MKPKRTELFTESVSLFQVIPNRFGGLLGANTELYLNQPRAGPIAKPPCFPYAWTMNTNPISPWGEPNSLSRRARAATQPNPACEPLCGPRAMTGGGSTSKSPRGAVELTQERLRALLHYDGDTGRFLWRVSRRGRAKIGTAAGTLGADGYLRILVDGGRYSAHRLAWLYVHGRWPSADLDHANGNPSDNRIANLRECNKSENQQNRKPSKNSTSGYMGVTFVRSTGKYQAYIKRAGKQLHLGCFPTPELAHAAYLAAKKELHTFNPVPRPS